ncbi:MAG: DUF2062 domain-containing protein [Rhodoferax sp.]|nr:DUF2062 domain-containing protein [Rhodoferax sp.]MBP7492519.1 DUF2062 domain-containing protein [Rhodoferax sp.]
MSLLNRLRRLIPSREQIHNNPRLAWMGPWVKEPKLWHWSRRGVAMGVALGVFFGLIIPVAQIPASVAAAVVMRANIPAAIASTLVSNPVTFGPIYYGAYKLGVWITGAKKTANPAAVFATAEVDEDASMWTRITALGKPLLVGLSITAVIMGLLTYGVITLVWRWRTVSKRRSRRRPSLPDL